MEYSRSLTDGEYRLPHDSESVTEFDQERLELLTQSHVQFAQPNRFADQENLDAAMPGL